MVPYAQLVYYCYTFLVIREKKILKTVLHATVPNKVVFFMWNLFAFVITPDASSVLRTSCSNIHCAHILRVSKKSVHVVKYTNFCERYAHQQRNNSLLPALKQTRSVTVYKAHHQSKSFVSLNVCTVSNIMTERSSSKGSYI